MFSANENILLRQHKKRIVDSIESTIPETALDLGTTVMVMQVSCQSPGCVPLETAIIIVFPKQSNTNSEAAVELIPNLPESRNGGNYKTKILKPMSDVTKDDILDALPPCFIGGRRTMSKLCINARDIMIAQITQLFGGTPTTSSSDGGGGSSSSEDTPAMIADRKAMAEYLQLQLQEYITRGCQPPEWGEPYPPLEVESTINKEDEDEAQKTTTPTATTATSTTTTTITLPATGNFVVRRNMENEPIKSPSTTTNTPSQTNTMMGISTSSSTTKTTTTTTTTTVLSSRPPSSRATTNAVITSGSNKNATSISNLFNREHAPGIRQPGCPCCDPENTNTIVENNLMAMM